MGIDTYDMHFAGFVQFDSLEHLEGTRCVQAPVIRYDHGLPLWQCGGDGNDRTWALFQHRMEGVVRLLLGFKVKKGVLTEQDQVIPLGFQENLLGGETDILEYLTRHICLGTSLRTVL